VILGDAAALILKICVEKITKYYSQQGAASKMFRDTSANSMSSPQWPVGTIFVQKLYQLFGSKGTNMVPKKGHKLALRIHVILMF
jgi:hypothetical protein